MRYSSHPRYYSAKEVIKDFLDLLVYWVLWPLGRVSFGRWKRHSEKKGVRRILLVFWGAAGDMLTSTAAIKALHDAYPAAEITALGSRTLLDILPGSGIVRHFMDYDRVKKEPFVSLVRQLREKKFDLACNLKWSSDRAALWTLLSGASFTLGAGPRHWQLFFHLRARPALTVTHQVERFINMVRALGLPAKAARPFMMLSEQSQKFARDFWDRNGLVHARVLFIHPGAKEEYKQWPAENFAGLISRIIREHSVKVLLGWGPGEKGLVQDICGRVNSRRVMIAPETKSINELGALIKRSSLFVGNCSAPMNAAVAVDTPAVALMGPNNPVVWSPFGEKHRTVVPRVRCGKCRLPCSKAYACQKSIFVGDVFRAVDELLKKEGALQDA